MILDTACQRACCGKLWLDLHLKILQHHRLRGKYHESSDLFKFGSGGPKQSSKRIYFPAALEGQETQGLLLGASVLDASIPFLASNTMLTKLGCIINMPEHFVHFTLLDVKLPLGFKHGHWAVKIVCFPSQVHLDPIWQALSDESCWHEPDPEVIWRPELSAQSQQQFDCLASEPHAGRTPTGLASTMEDHAATCDDVGVQDVQDDVTPGDIGIEAKGMVDVMGANHRHSGAPVGDGFTSPIAAARNMHSPGLHQVRQSVGKFCSMQEVPGKVQMEFHKTKHGTKCQIHPLRNLHACQHLLRPPFADQLDGERDPRHLP